METPSLLDLMGSPARQCGLRLAERYSQRPIYLFDLNVLFDAMRKRDRSDSAAKVIWAGMSNSIRLMVAAEFAKELLRTSRDPGNDPVLAFAAQADSLSRPPEKVVRSLIAKLAPAIFAERFHQGILTDRDRSDLTHIATAIHHRAAGFITSEKAILRAHAHLHDTWNLSVVGVEEFAGLVDAGGVDASVSVVEISSEMLRTRRNQESDLPQARTFLDAMQASPSFIHDALDCQGTQAQWLLVVGESRPLGFAKWLVYGGLKRTADIVLAVDEAYHAADTILDYLLDVIPRELSRVGPALVRLSVPTGQVATRQAALSSGFLPPYGAGDSHCKLQRLAVGRVVSSENWLSVRQGLMSAASVSLPVQMPTFAEASRQVLLNTGEREVGMSLADVESTLAPVLFLFPERGGVIVPIRECFARDLIGACPQLSMLAPPEAILHRERVYYSGPRTVGRMTPGTPMLFYESQKSKGRGCVTAIARITDSKIVSKVDALDKVQRRGVLDERTLETRSVGHKVTGTSFDNIFIFKAPVPFKRLRELGCADDSNLVSAKSISFEKLVQVVKEGRIDG